jgi:hypothetical protein
MIIVYKDGSWKVVSEDQAWEFQNDPDWLVSIPLQAADKFAQTDKVSE